MGEIKKIVIIGVGNILLSDEGIGVHVVEELKKIPLPLGVSVVDAGTVGFEILDFISDAHELIIIDAVDGGREPGFIYRFDFDFLEELPLSCMRFVHQIGVFDVLNILKLRGKAPKAKIIGVQPKSVDFGLTLSEELKSMIPKIIEIVLEEVKSRLDNKV